MRSDRSLPPVTDGPATLAERILGAPGLLLGLDFDGTLAPIVTDPDEATIAPAVVDPLERLCDAAGVAVGILSGRALDDLAERVPVDGVTLGGNHGLARRRDGDRQVVPAAADARDAVGAARDRLGEAITDVPGCRLEDKGLTLTVHVRETPSDRIEEVRAAVESVADEFDSLRLVRGKAVFEVRPDIEYDKGTAMVNLREEVPDDWLVVYVGDDTTDEDAFEAIQPEGIGIHVGDDPDTVADYALPDQTAVAPFLRWLADSEPVVERSGDDEK